MSDPYYNNGGGGFMQGGPSSQDGSRPPKAQQSLRPVTIKQFLNASQMHGDADFSIDDVDVQQVTFVGVVRNINISQTNVNLSLEDGTGSCEAKLWMTSADDEGGKMAGITQDMYIRVIGTLKTFANKRHIAASQILPITDLNEVFYHFLEAQYVSLLMRKGKISDSSTTSNTGDIGNSSKLNDYSMSAGGGGGGAEDKDWKSLSPVQRKILEYVKAHATDEGVHVREVANSITGFSHDTISNAIETLLTDGQLFTSMDDEHVMCT